jgi:hypothetical protein
MKIGFSVSMCVMDIIEGKAKIEDVTCIIAGTMAATEHDWLGVVESYCVTYWRKHELSARIIAMELWNSKRIVQPRVLDQDPPMGRVGPNRWLEI